MEATQRPSSTPGRGYSLQICVAVRDDLPRSDKTYMTIELPSGFLAVVPSLRELRYRGGKDNEGRELAESADLRGGLRLTLFWLVCSCLFSGVFGRGDC